MKTIGPRDVGNIDQSLPANIRQPLTRIAESLRRLLGIGTDGVGAALVVGSDGAITLPDGTSFGGGVGGVSGSDDLTPPPDVTGVVATAGLANIIVTWDAPIYTQGGGNAFTRIYAVKKAAADPTLPTFSDAVEVFAAPGPLTIVALPSDLAIRWHIWTKYESVAGVLSNDPAPVGSVNGAIAQTGLIGNVDLAPLLITADKLSQGTYPNLNLVPNPGCEDYDPVTLAPKAWTIVEGGGAGCSFLANTANKTGGTAAFTLNHPGGLGIAGGCLAFPVIPGETYAVKVRVIGSGPSAAGLYIRAEEKATKPTTGYIGGGGGGTDTRDSFTDFVSNGAIPGAWTSYEFSYTVPAGVYWVTLALYNWSTSTVSSIWFDDVSVGRQITAAMIAAGAIAVGTAAIQNGAIVNAMIGAAAIDDAKIANLSAAKLTAGSGVIGGPLKSSNYSSGAAGWILLPSGHIEANDIDIRGATYTGSIFAGAGTIGGITINATSLRSTNYVAGSAGFSINSDGSAEFRNLTATGNITANNLNAATGTFSGTLSAATGTFAGALSAATGSFGGSLIAATGSFAGSLSAATGTFAGSLTAAALVVAGQSLFAPAFASGSGLVNAPATGNTALATCSSVNPGSTGTVCLIATCEYNGTGSTGSEGDISGPFVAPTLALFRGSTQIVSWTPTAGAQYGHTTFTFTDTPGGAAAYSLRILAGGGAGALARTLLVLGVTR